MELTKDRLKQLFKYDPITGVFTRKIPTSKNGKVGEIAGCKNKDKGYIIMHIDNKPYLAHRLAWMYIYGSFPSDQIDHENHIRSDNRISNLRSVTHLQNHKNKSLQKNNTSGVTGVTWHKAAKKWSAQIIVNKKTVHLGLFVQKTDAIISRKDAEKLYLFHKNHGKKIDI